MAKVTVYVPDELLASAKGAGLNISAITQDGIKRELTAAGDYDLEQMLDSARRILDESLALVRDQT